jgi:hypothetical protein
MCSAHRTARQDPPLDGTSRSGKVNDAETNPARASNQDEMRVIPKKLFRSGQVERKHMHQHAHTTRAAEKIDQLVNLQRFNGDY